METGTRRRRPSHPPSGFVSGRCSAEPAGAVDPAMRSRLGLAGQVRAAHDRGSGDHPEQMRRAHGAREEAS
jgi:hypothetical protein